MTKIKLGLDGKTVDENVTDGIAISVKMKADAHWDPIKGAKSYVLYVTASEDPPSDPKSFIAP